MANTDLDWRPDGGMESYRGMDVWEYKVGPHHLNEGEVDGDIDLSDLTDD